MHHSEKCYSDDNEEAETLFMSIKLMAQHEDRRAMMMIPHADTVALVPYTIAERAIWRLQAE